MLPETKPPAEGNPTPTPTPPPDPKPGEGTSTPPPPSAAKPAEGPTPEQLEAMKEAGMSWAAVQHLFKKNADGSLEIDPSTLPRGSAQPTNPDDPDAAAAAEAERKRQEDIDRRVLAGTSAAADVINKDLSIKQKITTELAAEPGGDLILEYAQRVMDENVPVAKRNEKAWRNAVLVARGATESKRRENWLNEGEKRGLANLEKVHKIRIPRPGPTPKTEDEMAEELNDDQRTYCKRTGMDPKVFAKRLAQLKGGRS